MWLVKPRNRCCGEGIRLVNDPAKITNDLTPDKLGEWYVQRFVHPPPLVKGHKVVMRLFAVVTSFSPLRLSLYREGLLFWTNGAYSVADDTEKRKYITDYFFTQVMHAAHHPVVIHAAHHPVVSVLHRLRCDTLPWCISRCCFFTHSPSLAPELSPTLLHWPLNSHPLSLIGP